MLLLSYLHSANSTDKAWYFFNQGQLQSHVVLDLLMPCDFRKNKLTWSAFINISHGKIRKQRPFPYMDGLVQERHNSSALEIELCLSCTNPMIWWNTRFPDLKAMRLIAWIIISFLKFDWHVSSNAAKRPVTYHTNWTILNKSYIKQFYGIL